MAFPKPIGEGNVVRRAVQFTVATDQIVTNIGLMVRYRPSTSYSYDLERGEYVVLVTGGDLAPDEDDVKIQPHYLPDEAEGDTWREHWISVQLGEAVLLPTGTYWLVVKEAHNAQVWLNVLEWLTDDGVANPPACRLYFKSLSTWLEDTTPRNFRFRVPTGGSVWEVMLDTAGFMTPDHLSSYVTTMVQSGVTNARGGQQEHSQMLYPFSVVSQDDWVNGGGQISWEDPKKFHYALRVDTRVPQQAILGPQTVLTVNDAATVPFYVAGSEEQTMFQTLPNPALYSMGKTAAYLAQRVALDTSTYINKVGFWVRRLVQEPVATLTFEVRGDNNGNPADTVLASATVPWPDGHPHLHPTYVEVTFASPPYMAAGYCWLVVKSAGQNDRAEYAVFSGPPGGQDQPTKVSSEGLGTTWVTVYNAPFYVVNGINSLGLDGTPRAAALLDADLYAIAGRRLYQFFPASGRWFLAGLDTNDLTLLDMVEFDGKLYIAGGTTTWSFDGTTLTDLSIPSTKLFVGIGFLWRADGNNLYKSNNGVDWSAAIEIGTPGHDITGIVVYQGYIYVSRNDGLWWVDETDIPHHKLVFDGASSSTNGRGMAVWSDMLYIPVESGLLQWTGSLLSNRGPDDADGLPTFMSGRISCLFPTINALYAGVAPIESSAGSSILAFNGMGWHNEVYVARGGSIQMLFMQPLDSDDPMLAKQRLWFNSNANLHYVDLPTHTDNRYGWSGARYTPAGTLVLSGWDGGLHDAKKFFNRVRLEIEGLTSANGVEVWYSTNGAAFQFLGAITASMTEYALMFPVDLDTTKVWLACTLWTNDSASTPRLLSVSIEAITRAVPAYMHSFRILLADELIDLSNTPRTDRTGEEQLRQLRAFAAQRTPIHVYTPAGSFTGCVVKLDVVSRTLRAEGGTPKWDRLANVSVLEL